MDRAYLATSNQVSVTGVGQEQAAGTPGFLLDSPGDLHRCLNPAVHLLRPGLGVALPSQHLAGHRGCVNISTPASKSQPH